MFSACVFPAHTLTHPSHCFDCRLPQLCELFASTNGLLSSILFPSTLFFALLVGHLSQPQL
jgi:hypothetical protein